MRYLGVDSAGAPERFVSGAVGLKLDVVSKLRRAPNRRYLYTPAPQRRGRPRQDDAKVELSHLSRCTWVETVPPHLDLYTAQLWQV